MVIMIVGLGSIGSFLAREFSKTNHKLILVDFDVVSVHNIFNSIYLPNQVGLLKTKAIEKFLKRKNNIVFVTKKIDEVKLFDYDIVFDCRDGVYKKEDNLLKLSLTDEFILIDSTKLDNDFYIEQDYSVDLDKETLDTCISNLSYKFFQSKQLQRILSFSAIYKIDIPCSTTIDVLYSEKQINNTILKVGNTTFIFLPYIVDRIIEDNKIHNQKIEIKYCMFNDVVRRKSFYDKHSFYQFLSNYFLDSTFSSGKVIISYDVNNKLIKLIDHVGGA